MDSDNALLEFIGINSLDQLFSDVPDKIRIKNNSVNSGMSEMELLINSSDIGSRNNSNMSIFLGSGSYNRYIPSAVQNIIMRNEFITAYTPYQAEISQGMLQAIDAYEFKQCIIRIHVNPYGYKCRLFRHFELGIYKKDHTINFIVNF